MSLVFGHHSVAAQLDAAPERVRVLYIQKGRIDARTQALLTQAQASRVRVDRVERRWLDARVEGSHQGVAADCQALALATETELESRWPQLGATPLLLVLDGVTDPRNMGACLRSAGAAGVDAVLIPKRGSAPINELVLKTAAGALPALLVVEVTNLARRLKWLAAQGVWIYGADDGASQRWTEPDYRVATALVLGNEARGLRKLTREHCDSIVSIPMSGSVSSLNVSVAAGVLLFEVVRQRGQG